MGIREIKVIGEYNPIQLDSVKITVTPELNQRFTENLFVIYGNQFLYGPNLTKHFMRAMSRDSITVIAAMKAKGDYGLSVDSNRRAVLSDEYSINKYFALPYVFDSKKRVVDCFENVLKHQINAETMVRGMVHFNVNSYDKAYQMAGFIKMMEENTGEKIADIDDIVRRRMILE